MTEKEFDVLANKHFCTNKGLDCDNCKGDGICPVVDGFRDELFAILREEVAKTLNPIGE